MDKPVRGIEFPSDITFDMLDIISKYFNNNINDALVLLNLQLILIFASSAFRQNIMTKEDVKKVIYDILKEVQESVDSLVEQMYQIINKENINR